MRKALCKTMAALGIGVAGAFAVAATSGPDLTPGETAMEVRGAVFQQQLGGGNSVHDIQGLACLTTMLYSCDGSYVSSVNPAVGGVDILQNRPAGPPACDNMYFLTLCFTSGIPAQNTGVCVLDAVNPCPAACRLGDPLVMANGNFCVDPAFLPAHILQ